MGSNNRIVETAGLLSEAAWLRRLARHLVRDRALADDLVQEAWLAALEHPPDAGRPVRPWLARVLRNLARMRARGELRRARRERAAMGEGDEAVAAPESRHEEAQMQRELAALVHELGEPYRQTILLRYYEGMSAAAIGARQRIPAGTVRWRLKEGLDRLRARLDQKHGGDRRSWQRLLAPVAGGRMGQGTAGAAGPAAHFLKGALAMNVLLKGSLVVATAFAATLFVKHQTSAREVSAQSAAPSREWARAASPTPSPPSAPPALPRLDRAARARLLQAIEAARQLAAAAKPGPMRAKGALDKEYIRKQIHGLMGLVKECYENAARENPNLGNGKLTVHFVIVGEPGVGGLVQSSEIVDDQSTIADKDLRECVQETMYAAHFPEPEGGGEVVVQYPFAFVRE